MFFTVVNKKMWTSIVFLPLIIFIFLTIFSEIKNKILLYVGGLMYTVNLIVVSYLLVMSCFINYAGKYIYVYKFFNWSSLNGIDINLCLWLDYVSIIMCFTVIFVATMVNIFSIYYMANDPYIVRFFSYLALFTFCMLILVTSNNLIQFFLGWELVGICSYLLINFWYTRKQANISATKAVLVNRLGDFSLLYGISIVCVNWNTVSIIDLSWIFLSYSDVYTNINWLSFVFFIAVMSKSAQFGLHSWLPDAMEGPTPVSALIHAATMVTAGIFLILRLSNLFEISTITSKFIIIVGSFTSFFAASTGLAQTDIKKIIAFSTCSQLGYMVCICGFSQFNLAFFHLITHAFFKSLLFLCAGIVIHSMSGEQDIRKMGGLKNFLPSTYASMTIASWALSGIPYLAGYYSKELIVCYTFLINDYISFFSGILLIASAFLTSTYSAKLIFYVFLSKPRNRKILYTNFHVEGYDVMFTQIPLFFLTLFSIFSGYLFKDSIVGYGSTTGLVSTSEFSYLGSSYSWTEFVSTLLKCILFLSSVFGYVFFYFFYRNNFFFNLSMMGLDKKNKEIYSFFYNRWYFDFSVGYFINSLFLFKIENLFLFFLQNKVVDFLSINLFSNSVKCSSLLLKQINLISVQNYLYYTNISIVITLVFYHFYQDVVTIV